MQGLPLLDPSPYAIGIFPEPFFPEHYNRGQTASFKLDQKVFSWSKGDYTVTGVMDSNVSFIIKGKAMSWHGRRAITDAQGTELFGFHNELMHMHKTFVAHRVGSDREIFRVKAKLWSIHDDMTVNLWNEATNREEELHIRGDWLDRKSEIRLGSTGPVIAAIGRNIWAAKTMFTASSTYVVHVAPGVDAALIIALCVCLDELHNQNRNAGVLGALAAS